ncbi:MAG: energy transducer TonB [Gammaproteobacteria bacterium]|nr:energy transducer TonB [Gammaproteobacteria bacterium]
MVTKRHWLTGILFAITAHLVVFAAVVNANKTVEAKEVPGKGLDIDLGLLGEVPVGVVEKEEVSEPELEIFLRKEKPIEQVQKVEPDMVKQRPKIELAKQEELAVIQEKQPSKEVEVREVTPKEIVATAPATKKVMMHHRKTSGHADSKKQGGNPEAERFYYAELLAQLSRYKHYPNMSRRRHEEGVVTLDITINRDGSISSSNVSKSSGYKRLDRAVIRMLSKAAPLPQFYDDMWQSQLSIKLPIVFELLS